MWGVYHDYILLSVLLTLKILKIIIIQTIPPVMPYQVVIMQYVVKEDKIVIWSYVY